MAVKIVTDSTADLPDAIVDRLGITVVPVYVLIDDVAYKEGEDLSRGDFYARLMQSDRLPTTSQPTPGDFLQHFERLIAAGDDVVCITVPKGLSGTYNSAIQASRELSDGAITVIDANTASAGHMLQVIAAAEDAAAPDTTAGSVAERAEARAESGFCYCAVDTLEYLQRGGRIGKAQAFMGSLLKVKPILLVAEGEVLPVDRPRNTNRAMNRLEELVRSRGPATKLAVSYTTDQQPAHDLLARLSDLAPPEQSYIMQIGSGIGTHIGPGAVGVSTLS